MERDDLIYAAGLFDGEGCISTAQNSPKQMPRLNVTVQMCDVGVVAWLHQSFGLGTLRQSRPEKYYSGRCRAQFVWCCSSAQAEVVLRAMLPFLKVKQRQAERAIALRSLARGGRYKFGVRGQAPVPAESLAEARRLRLEISTLNKTGTLPE